MHDLDLLAGGLDHLGLGQCDARFVLVQAGNGGVEGQVAFQEQAVGLAFLGDQGKAVLDGLVGIVEVHQPVPEIDAARRAGAHAEDGLQQLGTAGAHQAVQAEDLALAHIKGDVLQVGRVLGGQVLDGQDGVAGGVVHRREPAFQRTADHGGDQLVHVGLFGGLGHDQVAVAQHRDLVADLEDLVHLVGNVDQRNALRLEHPHHFKQFVNFLYGQRGSGLVQNDHLGVVADRLGNLAHLPLRHRHVAHGLGQIDGHAQLAEQVGGLALHLPLVHNTH